MHLLLYPPHMETPFFNPLFFVLFTFEASPRDLYSIILCGQLKDVHPMGTKTMRKGERGNEM